MKVLHLISGGDTGGAKTHVHTLLAGLTPRIQVKMVCFTEGPFTQEARALGIDTEVIPGRNFFANLKKLSHMVQEEGFDLIHSHGARGNMMAAFLSKRTGLPTVSTVHSDYRLDYLGRPLSRLTYGTINTLALRKLDYRIGVSDAMVDLLISRKFDPERLFSIYNGLDFTPRTPAMNRAEYLRSVGLEADETFELVFDASVLKQMDTGAVPFAELSERLAGRPDMKMARTNIQVSRANVSLQKSLAFPEVSLKGSYDRAGNFCDNYFAVGLSISVPVFNRNQGNIKSARLAVLQNTNREELARRQAETELFTSYARLEKAVKLYRSSNFELERDFGTIIEGVNSNYQKRNISLLEFIDYYQAYKETCLQLYQTEKDVFLAMEEVNTVTGSDVFSY